MLIQFPCPKCKKISTFVSSAAGKQVKCCACDAVFRLPSAATGFRDVDGQSAPKSNKINEDHGVRPVRIPPGSALNNDKNAASTRPVLSAKTATAKDPDALLARDTVSDPTSEEALLEAAMALVQAGEFRDAGRRLQQSRNPTTRSYADRCGALARSSTEAQQNALLRQLRDHGRNVDHQFNDIPVTCPTCEREWTVGFFLAGKTVPCSECKLLITVPSRTRTPKKEFETQAAPRALKRGSCAACKQYAEGEDSRFWAGELVYESQTAYVTGARTTTIRVTKRYCHLQQHQAFICDTCMRTHAARGALCGLCILSILAFLLYCMILEGIDLAPKYYQRVTNWLSLEGLFGVTIGAIPFLVVTLVFSLGRSDFWLFAICAAATCTLVLCLTLMPKVCAVVRKVLGTSGSNEDKERYAITLCSSDIKTNWINQDKKHKVTFFTQREHGNLKST